MRPCGCIIPGWLCKAPLKVLRMKRALKISVYYYFLLLYTLTIIWDISLVTRCKSELINDIKIDLISEIKSQLTTIVATEIIKQNSDLKIENLKTLNSRKTWVLYQRALMTKSNMVDACVEVYAMKEGFIMFNVIDNIFMWRAMYELWLLFTRVIQYFVILMKFWNVLW